jgi:pimeloyl-ACP methyl ester carboxylesterase
VKSPISTLGQMFKLPDFEPPEGRWLELPRRGRVWLTDLPGPTPDAQAVVLLHAVGCTGLLTWFPALEELNKRYRVITFDQRWHGRGITSERFLVSDCADDTAALIDELGLVDPIVAGFSMGSIVAQRLWRQHPDAVGGLVLCATTDHFRRTGPEIVFHSYMEVLMGLLHSVARSQVLTRAARTLTDVLKIESTDVGQWALAEFRSTSPWAVGQAVASLGRFHSTPWLHMVDVPTAVVVTTRDKVLTRSHQRSVASRIPHVTVHEADCGHAGCVLQAEAFLPPFLQAVNTTAARVRDLQSSARVR